MGRRISLGVAGTSTPGSYPSLDLTSGVTASANKIYWCNTTSAAFTLTLPSAAVKGDVIRIYDVANTFDTNNLTVDRNGHVIMGAADNLVVSTEGAAFDLVYYDSSKGWRIYTI